MPVQTRSKVPVDRVYYSPAAQGQVKFKPRKQHVTSRNTLGAKRRSSQQTLTQIDFVDFQAGTGDDSEKDNMFEDGDYTRKSKRRRTGGDLPSSASNLHTQTLTQLEFVSTPASMLEHNDEVENSYLNGVPDFNPDISLSPIRKMGPPKTPSRRRVYEVPSSQSPLSPASTRSRRPFPKRSPLKALDPNFKTQKFSPLRKKDNKVLERPKMEIADTFEDNIGSQQSLLVLQTPKREGTQKHYKYEIQDSDEEDEDLDTLYDDHVQESQLYQQDLGPSLQLDVKDLNPILSDTQEAEEQLQNTIVQFTQRIPSSNEHEIDIPPSQATTVSLTQPPSSSPFTSGRSRHEIPGAMASLSNDDSRLLLVPDSPSHRVSASGTSLSLTLPRLPPPETQQIEKTAVHHTFIKRRQKREDQREKTPPHFAPFSFLPSPQLLTRSQMLPESLMNDSVPAPPMLIEDSDYEE